MGTNYYAIPKATEEIKRKIIKAVEFENFEEAKRLLPERIHIGKSSIGWKFCFNHNDWKYFDKSLESLKEFLRECDIEDEYKRIVDQDEFWGMVESKNKDKGHLVFDGSTHGTMEFGLNFSTSTNFC